MSLVSAAVSGHSAQFAGLGPARSAQTLRLPFAKMTEKPERRDPVRRAVFVQSVVTHVIQSPVTEFDVETLQQLLNISPEIVHRILRRLSSAGLLQEQRRGVWVKVTPTKALHSPTSD